MEIPKKIKIGGFEYDVDAKYTFKERVDRLGYVDDGLKKIFIADNVDGLPRNQRAIEQTFWHEVLHCIDNVYNADKLEEETVNRISSGLYQVLKDNNFID